MCNSASIMIVILADEDTPFAHEQLLNSSQKVATDFSNPHNLRNIPRISAYYSQSLLLINPSR